MSQRKGACRCGQVQFTVIGEPKRVGICHCTDCRHESGSAFTYYGVWAATAFSTTGETAVHNGRRFCPTCGSRLFGYDDKEAEIKLGSLLEAPTGLTPTYELWIKRREPWVQPIARAEQFEEDRTEDRG
jgi:hypothetical protein